MTAQEVNSLFSQRTAVAFTKRELSPQVNVTKLLENSVQIPALLHILCMNLSFPSAKNYSKIQKKFCLAGVLQSLCRHMLR